MTKYYKYNIYLLFTYLLLVFFCTNSFGYEWIKTYGGIGLLSGSRTNDGGYVIMGRTIAVPPSFDTDLVLVKTDGNGNEQWRKTYGIGHYDNGKAIQQTNDGGYIITGYTIEPEGLSGTFLMKTEANGDKQWSKIFSYGFGNSVQQTDDGGYIIAGDAANPTTGEGLQQWVYLMKTDGNGNKQWSKTFAEYAFNEGYSVQQTTDGGFIIAGTTSSDVLTTYFYLVKTDGNGNKQWSKTFAGEYGYDWGYSVQQTTDGGFIIAGDTMSLSVDNGFGYLIKTDGNGNKQWSRTFGRDNNYTHFVSVQQTNDGGYISVGRTAPKPDPYTDIYLLKTDGNGNKQWSRTFGGNSGDYGSLVQQTDDGGYIIFGGMSAGINSPEEAYLIYFRPTESKAMPWIPLLLLDE